MILTILFFVLLLIGIVLLCKFTDCYSILGFLGMLLTIINGIVFTILILVIIFTHGFAEKTIQENQIRYDGLVKRLEIIQSDYEDVSRSDVISDITEWNTDVYKCKYWTDNLLTNWFNPRSIAYKMEYIPLE